MLQRFAADAGALAKLKVGDAVALAEAIRAMDKAGQAADVVVRWIAAPKGPAATTSRSWPAS